MVRGIQRWGRGEELCARDIWNLTEGQVSSFDNLLLANILPEKPNASTLKTPGRLPAHRAFILQEQVASAPWWLFLSSSVSPFQARKHTSVLTEEEGPEALCSSVTAGSVNLPLCCF